MQRHCHVLQSRVRVRTLQSALVPRRPARASTHKRGANLMKRTLAALAALGSCAAFAPSGVNIYGVMDVGFTHGSGDVASFKGLTSGRTASSRIGFRGVEDLGGGLKASFVLE